MKTGAPMPGEARTLSLAERFHVPPWEIEQAPIDTVLRWIGVMSIEGEVLAARRGMPSSEPLTLEGDDEDEWSDAV